MQEEIKIKLRAWADAHTDAARNSSLIQKDSSDLMLHDCAARVRKLQTATDALLDLEGTPGLPSPLKAFLKARADVPCGVCAQHGPTHIDCARKVDTSFRQIDVLKSYVLNEMDTK